jgi:spore coat protein H
MKRLFLIRLLFGVCLATMSVSAQEPRPAPAATEAKVEKKEKTREAEALFVRDKVWNIHIIVTPEEWKKIEPPQPTAPIFPAGNAGSGAGRPGFPQIEFPEVRAIFEFEGQPVGEIGLRYKGNSTYMAARNTLKKSFKVDFNQFNKKLRFHGLTKLNLNNNLLDSSQMREALSYDLFRWAGVPAGRTSFARVSLSVAGEYDKKYLGLYTLVEQVDERFLRNHFGSDDGLLLKPQMVRGLPYLGENWQSYIKPYEAKNKPPTAESQRFIAFTKLVNEASDAEFRDQIRTFMDVRAFVRFIAVNGLLVNMDSILAMGQNYYIYHDTVEDQFHWIPWDLNMALGGFPAGSAEQMTNLSLKHPHTGEHGLIDRLLGMDEVKADFLAQTKELADKLLRPGLLNSEIEKLKAAIRPAIAEESAQSLAAFDQAIDQTLPEYLKAAPSGFARPTGFGRPGGLPGLGIPLKAFFAPRAIAVQKQLAGKTEGYVSQFGGFGRGGPGRGGLMMPPGGGFNFGEMFASRLMQAADADRDQRLSKAELVDAATRWFGDWNTAKKRALDTEALARRLGNFFVLPSEMPELPGGMMPPALPAGGPSRMMAQNFLAAGDVNHDHQFTQIELTNAFSRWFRQWDENHDQALTLDELGKGLRPMMLPPGFGPPQATPVSPTATAPPKTTSKSKVMHK